jgi:glycine betaine/choline ABC-type transport system substrate-binding protein
MPGKELESYKVQYTRVYSTDGNVTGEKLERYMDQYTRIYSTDGKLTGENLERCVIKTVVV